MEFYEKLHDEAEAERKQKKRNQLSGLYKYLNLVEGADKKFTYLRDSMNNVISLPPLTNSEETKMSTSTKNILIEVTSSVSIDICKKVMEELFTEMLNHNITSKVSDDELSAKTGQMTLEQSDDSHKLRNTMVLQQVKIVDNKGTLKTVYPSRVDLTFGGSKKFQIRRLYDEE